MQCQALCLASAAQSSSSGAEHGSGCHHSFPSKTTEGGDCHHFANFASTEADFFASKPLGVHPSIDAFLPLPIPGAHAVPIQPACPYIGFRDVSPPGKALFLALSTLRL
jgi:hypothetical protein